MDEIDSPARSVIVVPVTHSPFSLKIQGANQATMTCEALSCVRKHG